MGSELFVSKGRMYQIKSRRGLPTQQRWKMPQGKNDKTTLLSDDTSTPRPGPGEPRRRSGWGDEMTGRPEGGGLAPGPAS